MISVFRPGEATIRRFLQRQRGHACAPAADDSAFQSPPAGFVLDRHRVRLGAGEAAFSRGCAAVREWRMLRLGWAEVATPDAPVAVGTDVGVIARGFGVWCLFACRVVRVDERHGDVESFGLTYAALPGHVLEGQERFAVTLDRAEGSVWYEVTAFSRPAGLVGRLGYPVVRRLQQRFGPASTRAMARAAGGAA